MSISLPYPTPTLVNVSQLRLAPNTSLNQLREQEERNALCGYNRCNLYIYHIGCCGPGSVVGIPTGYGLDGPGIECRRDRDFPDLSRPVLGPTQTPVQSVPGLSRG